MARPQCCRDTATRSGPKNIAAYYPDNATMAPDLGTYFALAVVSVTHVYARRSENIYRVRWVSQQVHGYDKLAPRCSGCCQSRYLDRGLYETSCSMAYFP